MEIMKGCISAMFNVHGEGYPPDFSFKIATVKLTPAFSKLASKSNGGCKRKPKEKAMQGR